MRRSPSCLDLPANAWEAERGPEDALADSRTRASPGAGNDSLVPPYPPAWQAPPERDPHSPLSLPAAGENEPIQPWLARQSHGHGAEGVWEAAGRTELQWQDEVGRGLGEAPPEAHDAAGDGDTGSDRHVATGAVSCPTARMGGEGTWERCCGEPCPQPAAQAAMHPWGRHPEHPCLVLPSPMPCKSKWAASDSGSGRFAELKGPTGSAGRVLALPASSLLREDVERKDRRQKGFMSQGFLKSPLGAPGDTAVPARAGSWGNARQGLSRFVPGMPFPAKKAGGSPLWEMPSKLAESVVQLGAPWQPQATHSRGLL